MTTEELVKNLFSDRNGRFVHDASGHFSFEDELEKGKTLSEVFAARIFEDKVELLKECYKLADETVVSMNTPFKVKIKLSEGYSGTDSREVIVSTKHFDDERLTTGQAADIFIGLAVHEACHLLYTDFEARSSERIVQMFANIIEDERIERKLREHRPGLIPFIAAVKEYYFDPEYTKVDTSRFGRIEMFTNTLIKMIRYPKSFEAEELDEFGEYLLKAKDILTPYPDSTQESLDAARKIYDLLKDMSSEEEKKEEGKGDGKEEDEKKDKSEDSSESSSDSSDSSSEDSKKEPSEEDGSGSEGESDSSDGEMKKIEDLLEKIPGSCTSGEKPTEKCDGIRRTDFEIIDGTAEKGKNNDVFFRKGKNNKGMYNTVYDEIKKYVPAVARQIRGYSVDRNLKYTGLRSGKLDTHKLSQAVQGAQNVYYQNFKQVTNGITVCILVDESGSMIREQRAENARKMAILLNEAIGKLDKVSLYIYGHTADLTFDSTDLIVYKENNVGNKYSLGSIDAQINNRDGIAILEVATRIRKKTKDPVLMFVISDGAPAAIGYLGKEAIAHTKKCVESVEKMGFDIVQICISTSYNPALMFKKYIKLEDMSTFPHDLGKIIKHKVLRNMKAKIIDA